MKVVVWVGNWAADWAVHLVVLTVLRWAGKRVEQMAVSRAVLTVQPMVVSKAGWTDVVTAAQRAAEMAVLMVVSKVVSSVAMSVAMWVASTAVRMEDGKAVHWADDWDEMLVEMLAVSKAVQ